MAWRWQVYHLLYIVLIKLILIDLSLTQSATTIPFPPTIVKQPPSTEQLFQVSQNQDEPDKSFMLECQAFGNPQPTYQWMKNGKKFDYMTYDRRISQQAGIGTLLFTKPDDIDEGIYQCLAENEHGIAVSNTVFLRKSELNSFADEESRDVYVMEGDPLTLDCDTPLGYPTPTLFWIIQSNTGSLRTINDSRITVDPTGNLHFSNVTKADALDDATYACSATSVFRNEYKLGNKITLNVEPSGSNNTFLMFIELNSFADEESRDVYVMEGDPLTLDCDTPLGYPTPTLFWIIQSNTGSLRTINDSRITVDPTGNLHFSNVTKADALDDATYACSATSVFRNEYKLGNKITLNVEPSGITGEGTHALRQQYVSPANIVALRNKPLELFCIFGGTPLPTITWKKRGGKLPTGRIAYKNYGKTLNIRRVDFQDEGTYECVADNDVGIPQTHTMAVTVQASPYWLTSPNDTNAAEEEVVKFECNAKGIPEPTLKWFVNGVPLEDAEPNPRRKIDGNMLTIENLEKTDTAVYQCNASNVHGYAFADFYLNVLALPPTIIERPEPVTMAVVSSTVTLRCNVFGAPKPEIKWEKDGETLEGERFTLLENGDFQIKDVAKEDEGDYTCYASNKFGDEEAMGRLEVKVKTKIYQAPKNFEVAAGKSATFRCEAEVDPNLKLQIEWLFNDKPIDFDQDARIIQSSDKSLTITKTVELDSGTYTCIAKTSLDEDRASAMLIVQVLVLVSVSMTPWANYTFRVIARNKIGPSAPSAHSTNCSTPPDVPYRNPDNVKGRGTRKDNLVISWTVMPKIEQNAPGFYYKVYWKRDDIPNAKWNIEEIKDWEKNELVIEDQPTFKPYRIKVEAHNEKGSAHVAATEFIGYSGEDDAEPNPRRKIDGNMLTIENLEKTDTAVYQCNASNVHGYAFADFYLNVLALPPTIIERPEPVTMAVVSSTVTLRCNVFGAPKPEIKWEKDGETLEGERFTVKTLPPTIIERPEPVTMAVVSSTVTLRCNVFGAPKPEIKWEKDGETLEGERFTVKNVPNPPKITGVKCEGLTALVEWQPKGDRQAAILGYTIQFNTSFLPDVWEDAFVNIPAPDTPPGPVANFDAIPMGSSALYLIWKKPLEPNGILTGYKIYYEEVNGTELGQQIERTPPIDDPREARAKLAGLHADTKYRVTIQATTSKGAGVPYFIETKTNKKAESAPDVPDLVWSRLPDVGGKAGIRVTWVPAVDGHPGSHFFVQYKKKGDTQWESTAIEENQDSVTIHGLELGSLYELKVIAVDGGFQTASKIEEIETGGLAPDVPDLVWSRLPDVGGKAGIRVTWVPAVDGHPGSHFFVQYKKKGDTQWESTAIEENQDSVTIHGLELGSLYELKVIAVDGGFQTASKIEEIETGGLAPDVPDLVWSRLPDVGGKAGIRVTWVPAVDGHPGSHFFVQYKKKGDTQWESTAIEENQDSVTIHGLELGSLYELKVIAVDGGFQTASKIEEIETGGLALTVPEPSNIATAAWFIGMMCAIALLLLLLIIVCLIKRNRGGKYSVHEKEAAQGGELDYPEEGGFNEYNKPVENQNPPRGSRTSLNSSIKGPESETDSMVEYGEGENSKFTEDGSFIGQYGAKKKKEEDTTSPSALATFV
ncbi:neuroglian-like [Centruroides sculpturatus]|uniref:neuroglian-like n=1 Tax=Centruroides sculpturatus TaxID=218467 RepID=UPI000C6E4B6B|nr:neuroglian-like [Centruroides sculpturatus]